MSISVSLNGKKRKKVPKRNLESVRVDVESVLRYFNQTRENILQQERLQQEEEDKRNEEGKGEEYYFDDAELSQAAILAHTYHDQLCDLLRQLPPEDDATITIEAREAVHQFHMYIDEKLRRIKYILGGVTSFTGDLNALGTSSAPNGIRGHVEVDTQWLQFTALLLHALIEVRRRDAAPSPSGSTNNEGEEEEMSLVAGAENMCVSLLNGVSTPAPPLPILSLPFINSLT